MLEYIYFVKCPGCDDEPFYFFDEAKDFALSCLSKKPIISQTEVNRNDFGECTDSADLGTVWSWEEMMTDDEPAKCVFTKDDLKHSGCDAEFDALDNSLESAPANFRKPVPTDITAEELVEEMEENEDTVECKWCDELFDKSECRYEVDLGWLCNRCQAAIKSRGETLTFREGPLEEGVKVDNTVDFEYDDLTITVFGTRYDVDDWEEDEYSSSYTYTLPMEEVATDIWENFITEEDAADVPGGLETLENDKAWNAFLETHFDALLDKYYQKLLKRYEKAATEEFQDKYNSNYRAEQAAERADRAYDEWRDSQYFEEGSSKPKSYLEELEEAVDYRKHLDDCPECGVSESFDHETGICINCGFNI